MGRDELRFVRRAPSLLTSEASFSLFGFAELVNRTKVVSLFDLYQHFRLSLLTREASLSLFGTAELVADSLPSSCFDALLAACFEAPTYARTRFINTA